MVNRTSFELFHPEFHKHMSAPDAKIQVHSDGAFYSSDRAGACAWTVTVWSHDDEQQPCRRLIAAHAKFLGESRSAFMSEVLGLLNALQLANSI